MQIRVSLDKEGFHEKPEKHTAKISSRIAAEIKCCGIEELAELVGVKGHTFCPAVFTKRRRKAENFKEMQVFALDFDNGVSYEKIVRISKDPGGVCLPYVQLHTGQPQVPDCICKRCPGDGPEGGGADHTDASRDF